MRADQRPFLAVTWADPVSDATGYVVIDQLVTGIATGGLRMRAGCTMQEVADLAREMTLKTGAYGLPVGGAKGGIDHPSGTAAADGVRLRFLNAMRPLLNTVWVTAGDLGTPQAGLDQTFTQADLGPSSLRAGLRRCPDPEAAAERVSRLAAGGEHGLAMPDLIGGYGVAQAGLAGLEGLGVEPPGARAVVQGFGAMGGSSAFYLHRAGVRVVGISDASGLVANSGRGLDVPALLAGRRPGGFIDRELLRDDDQQCPGESWLDLDAEMIVPAAVSYSITEKNCDRVRARLVCEAANVPVTLEAERQLSARGVVVIPDFVANAGAAAWAWWAIFDLVPDPAASRELLASRVRPLVSRLMRSWRETGVSPRDSAREIAESNTARLRQRYGDVAERVPLYDAGREAARSYQHQANN